MTEDQIFIIKQSWKSVIMNSQEAGELFYQKLFEIDPSLRSLFRHNLGVQSRKMIAMLTYFVAKVQHMEKLAGEINAFGQKHAGYGAQPKDYDTVRQALWWMLEHILGNRWNRETREAWELAYELLSKKMLESYPSE